MALILFLKLYYIVMVAIAKLKLFQKLAQNILLRLSIRI